MSLKLVLFDDNPDPERIAALVGTLKTTLHANGDVHHFRLPKGTPEEGMYEDRIFRALGQAPFAGANMIVADRDLSATDGLSGLSESTVKLVADKLVIPECAYARDAQLETEFLKNAEQREARIVVSLHDGEVRFAEQVVSIAKGFSTILARLPEAMKTKGRKSPGRLLASLLEKPEYADKISLYAAGDQNRIAAVLNAKSDQTERRLACLLGYWLWDSVLRYPGVVVNEIAAGSYLNIGKDEFSKPEVRKLFDSALYNGPFSVAKGLLWWRGMLDDFVSANECTDGRELVAKKLDLKVDQVQPSQCCEDPAKQAGYYCMLSHQSVSLGNSHAGLSWFPRGADLARICNTQFNEEVPWITG